MTTWLRSFITAFALTALGAAAAFAQDAFPSSRCASSFRSRPAARSTSWRARSAMSCRSAGASRSSSRTSRGAGGIIAEQALTKSPADGYTLIVVATGHALNGHFYAKLPYDPFNDFTPISLIGTSPNMLLVRADSPFKSVGDVIAAARAAPGKLSYGHPGNGTSPHLAGELLKYMAKVDITPVPYKGGAPTLNDLLGGHIPMSINNIPESITQVKAGAVRAARRDDGGAFAGAAGCADHRRGGMPGYDTGVWWGFLAPAHIPAAVRTSSPRIAPRSRKLPAREGAVPPARRLAHWLDAGRVRQAHPRRIREMGPGAQGRRHQSGVN